MRGGGGGWRVGMWRGGWGVGWRETAPRVALITEGRVCLGITDHFQKSSKFLDQQQLVPRWLPMGNSKRFHEAKEAHEDFLQESTETDKG